MSLGFFSNRWVFLFLSFALLALLAYSKMPQDLEEPDTPTLSPVRRAIPTTTLEVDGQTFAVALSPVSQEEFSEFVTHELYTTWRERYGFEPSWRESHQATYLHPEDASRYCKWLSQFFGKGALEIQLPSAALLEKLQSHSSAQFEGWEWTHQTLENFSPHTPGASRYRTAWHPQNPLRHRREQDVGRSDVQPTGFRICWITRP